MVGADTIMERRTEMMRALAEENEVIFSDFWWISPVQHLLSD
jgi:hypothetical protein